MKRFEGLSSVREPFPHAAVTLGNFDGVHRGHRIILRETVAQARSRKGIAVVYTFYPHPVKLLAPHSCPPLIQTIDQRLESFESLGVDACVIDAFSFNLAHEEPRAFFDKVVMGTLGAEAIVVGYDFTFGLHRRGTTELLHQLGQERGLDVTVVEAQFEGELLISSTEIRRAVHAGEVDRAAALMEAPFALRGTVVRGRGIGESLGIHTANIAVENDVLPREGVYITHSRIVGEGKLYPSITSLGYNPTFKGTAFTVETHLIDFQGNLAGHRLDVLFHARLRGQIAFDTPETLKGQIERDIKIARSWHEEHRL